MSETKQSWLRRIAALLGSIIGLIFVLLAVVLLFWNARQSMNICKTIREGTEAVLSVPADSVNPANQGKLVHVNGRAITEATLNDSVFGVAAQALLLRREVEMYQWEEKKSSDATREYSTVWADHLVNSSSFENASGHENPAFMPYQTVEHIADKVTLGAFTLPASVIRTISETEPVPVSNNLSLPEDLAGRVHQYDGGLYIGENPDSPQIGDMQIRFVIVPQEEITVLAEQDGSSLVIPQTSPDKEMFAIREGLFTARHLFHKAEEAKIGRTWRLRLFGFLLLLVGVFLLLKTFSVQADFIDTSIMSFLLAGIVFLVTIAIAWITSRPLLGIGLLTAAVILIILVQRKMSQAKVKAAI